MKLKFCRTEVVQAASGHQPISFSRRSIQRGHFKVRCSPWRMRDCWAWHV